MNLQETEIARALAPKKSSWKRWTLAVLSLFLLWLAVTLWAMHQPWGELRPGVRLAPLRVYTQQDVTPGCFWELQQKALKAYVEPADRRSLEEIYQTLRERGRRFWQQDEYPELVKQIANNQPALELLNQASQQSEGFSLLPSAEQSAQDPLLGIAPIVRLSHLALAQATLGGASFDEGMLQLRVSSEFRNGVRMENGADHLFGLVAISRQKSALATMRSAAQQGVAVTVLEDWSQLIAKEISQKLPIIEIMRNELLRMSPAILTNGSNQYDEERPLKNFSSIRTLIGSGDDDRSHHYQLYQSELLYAIEQNPKNPDFASIQNRFFNINPRWLIYLKSDPISRLVIASMTSLMPITYHHFLQALAQIRATQAVLALHLYHAHEGKWPASLSEAMPEVPLDPFDGQPLRYRLNADGSWVVYALGSNRVDDGGDPSWVLDEKPKDEVYPSNELEIREQAWQRKHAPPPPKTKPKKVK